MIVFFLWQLVFLKVQSYKPTKKRSWKSFHRRAYLLPFHSYISSIADGIIMQSLLNKYIVLVLATYLFHLFGRKLIIWPCQNSAVGWSSSDIFVTTIVNWFGSIRKFLRAFPSTTIKLQQKQMIRTCLKKNRNYHFFKVNGPFDLHFVGWYSWCPDWPLAIQIGECHQTGTKFWFSQMLKCRVCHHCISF